MLSFDGGGADLCVSFLKANAALLLHQRVHLPMPVNPDLISTICSNFPLCMQFLGAPWSTAQQRLGQVPGWNQNFSCVNALASPSVPCYILTRV